jgi:carbonic anhydrase
MSPFPLPPDPNAPPRPEDEIRTLLEGNRHWVETWTRDDPETFPALSRTHRPPFLLVGCCDARMPMDLITEASPGHLFLHRNVANQVRTDDPAIAASFEFALGTLGVRHLIVCGHTGCGGAKAALADGAGPAVDRWVAPIRRLAEEREEELSTAEGRGERADLLAALSVVRQLENALEFDSVQAALADPERILRLHGWMFHLDTGRIKALDLPEERWREEGRFPA